MKRFLTACLLGLLAGTGYGQTAETVYPYSRRQLPVSWYKEQISAWEKVVAKHPKDANAWYNYYYATRIVQYHDPENRQTEGEKKAETDRLLAGMYAQVPATYEYNLVRWLAGGLDTSLLPYLYKADALAGGRADHLYAMINVAEIEGDTQRRNLYARKAYDAGRVSTGMLYYNYNVLAGLPKGAVLITVGDNDTYPVWVLQASGIRPDVTVVNLDMILLDGYRGKVWGHLGLPKLRAPAVPAAPSGDGFAPAQTAVLEALLRNGRDHPVCIGLTAVYAAKTLMPAIEEHLYLTGLVYQYSSTSFDNTAVLQRNFEQDYALDYLDKSFYSDVSADLVRVINTNYIVPMLKLYEHYTLSGDWQKRERLKSKLLAIGRGTSYDETIRRHLAQP